jgi:hypothetical protein
MIKQLFGIDDLIQYIGLEDEGNRVVAIFSDTKRPGVYRYLVLELEVLYYPQLNGWCFRGGTNLYSLDQNYRKTVKELFARYIQAASTFDIDMDLLDHLAENILSMADQWVAEEEVLEEIEEDDDLN